MRTIITSDLARVLRGFGIPPRTLAYTVPTTLDAVINRIGEAREEDTIITFGERLAPGTPFMNAIHSSPAEHIPVAILTTTSGSGIYHADTTAELHLDLDFPAPDGVRIYAVDSFCDWVKLFVGPLEARAEASDLSRSA